MHDGVHYGQGSDEGAQRVEVAEVEGMPCEPSVAQRRFDEGGRTGLARSPHRYAWPAELDLMARLVGFELLSRHADWTGAEFTAGSRSPVSVYRLPGEG